jgi:hypothetical protein
VVSLAFYLRKLNTAKWDYEGIKDTATWTKVKADISQTCLIPHVNTLSVWRIDFDDWEKIENSDELAALYTTRQKPNRTDVLIIPENVLNEFKISIVASRGESAGTDKLNDRHFDLSNLTLEQYSLLAQFFVEEISVFMNDKEKSRYLKRFSEKKVKKTVINALARGSIVKGNLDESWTR